MTVYAAFANCHSHAFHRALRGRNHRGSTFWGWRDGMYGVAEVLDPDLYHRLARATYALMVSLLPATAAVVGVIVLAQLPAAPELAGIALIVGGVALHREQPVTSPAAKILA